MSVRDYERERDDFVNDPLRGHDLYCGALDEIDRLRSELAAERTVRRQLAKERTVRKQLAASRDAMNPPEPMPYYPVESFGVSMGCDTGSVFDSCEGDQQ